VAEYLATNQPTAAWLLEKKPVLEQLVEVLRSGQLDGQLNRGIFSEGAVRIAKDSSDDFIVIWNIDYLSGLNDEGIGFVKFAGDFGLLQAPSLIHQTVERSLFVINQRLRNLIFDSSFFHQGPYNDGGHKILAGRGSELRDYSLGYIEQQVAVGRTSIKAVLCVGPERAWQKASSAAATHASALPSYSITVSNIIGRQGHESTTLATSSLKRLREAILPPEQRSVAGAITSRAEQLALSSTDVYKYAAWDYEAWTSKETVLSPDQSTILNADTILKHPLRIIGPAGSGKTLLMQLMAMRRLRAANNPETIKVLYATHNHGMEVAVRERFYSLGAEEYLKRGELAVTTLARYATDMLGLKHFQVLEADAELAKKTQLGMVTDAFVQAVDHNAAEVRQSPILSAMRDEPGAFAEYLRAEISIAIKGHRKDRDRQGYIGAERPLGRLHAVLTPEERTVVFETFEIYQASLDQLEVLDTDDVAITLMSEVTTPLWMRRRKSFGFDFIFVDEAQLFSENEQRIFPHLSRDQLSHAPIALALDEAQQFYGEPATGLALLGLPDIAREQLRTNHRMSQPIADLAFFVIAHGEDLFRLDFPSFEDYRVRGSDIADATLPSIEIRSADATSLARFVVSRVRRLRSQHLRQIAIVCHADAYWAHLAEALPRDLADLDLSILQERGQRPRDHSFVVLSRPNAVGGQEFDAVICVGLEKGHAPRLIPNDAALQSALDQQALRDIYLAVSRARHRVLIINERDSVPNDIVLKAINAGLVAETELGT
jgi:superfamily I DNA/RNA helicase